MVYNSGKVIYTKLKIYMHSSYVNGEDRCPKTLLAALNVLVNWKGRKRPSAHQYEPREGVSLTTKGNPVGLKGD